MERNERQEEAIDCNSAVSRRTLLKIAAGIPLVLTFGLVTSPLARFLKPSMRPGGFFQEADIPAAVRNIEFNMADFPYDLIGIPFEYQMKIVVFNPEQEEIRKIPGIAVRIAPDEIVAFSRICPRRGHLLHYKPEMCCGCMNSTVGPCDCASKKSNPVLVCPNCYSTFDLARLGYVVSGPAPRPPRQFRVRRQGDLISINEFELGSIA